MINRLNGPDAYRWSIVLLALTFVNYSFGGLIVRGLQVAEPWQVVFWRAASMTVVFSIYLFARYGRALPSMVPAIGWWGVVAGFVNGVAPAAYVFALENTTVANAVFILAAIPFITAVVARVTIGETISMRTLVAMPIAFSGIVLMVGAGLSHGALTGNLYALVTAVAFSCYVVILRHSRARNMQPTLVIGGIIGMTVGFLMSGADVSLPWRDIALCAIWGAFLNGIGHIVLMWTSQHVPSAEITFVMLVEFVLAPIWVWLFINEVPRLTTLVGGGIVLTAVTGWAWAGMRRQVQKP